jgi:hypothetical protein
MRVGCPYITRPEPTARTLTGGFSCLELIFGRRRSLIDAMGSKRDIDELRRLERLCLEQAERCVVEEAGEALRELAGNYRAAADALDRIAFWTQFWTQTKRNGIELDGLRWTRQGPEKLEKPTQSNGTALDETIPFVFQGRRHSPAHQHHLALGAGVAHDGRRIVGKHAGHRRQVANVAV